MRKSRSLLGLTTKRSLIQKGVDTPKKSTIRWVGMEEIHYPEHHLCPQYISKHAQYHFVSASQQIVVVSLDEQYKTTRTRSVAYQNPRTNK
jgi:hypothetical protein